MHKSIQQYAFVKTISLKKRDIKILLSFPNWKDLFFKTFQARVLNPLRVSSKLASRVVNSCGNILQKDTKMQNFTTLPGNTKGGSITVPLTSCLTGLD